VQPAALFEFRAILRSRLRSLVLADDHALIRVERAATSFAKYYRIGVDRVPARSPRDLKRVPSFWPHAKLAGIKSAAQGPGRTPFPAGPSSASEPAYLPNCDIYCVCMLVTITMSRTAAISVALKACLPTGIGSTTANVAKAKSAMRIRPAIYP
jgi:hypothetical protein